MARWISAELRQTVADRAKGLCEYCLIAEADTFYGCEGFPQNSQFNMGFGANAVSASKVVSDFDLRDLLTQANN